jgi:hypothetical protein
MERAIETRNYYVIYDLDGTRPLTRWSPAEIECLYPAYQSLRDTEHQSVAVVESLAAECD